MTEPQPTNADNTPPRLSQSRLRKVGKFIFRATLGISLGLILLIASLLLFLNTESAQHLILRYVNGVIPGELELDPLRFSLINGQIELNRVRLKAPDRSVIAAFDKLYLEFSWMGMLQKSLVINTIVLHKPMVNLVVAETGELNIITAFPPAKDKDEQPDRPQRSGGLPFRIAVKKIRITEGGFNFRHPAQGFEVDVAGVNLAADAEIPALTGKIDLSLQDIEVSHPELNYHAHRLKISGAMRNGRLDPLTLRLESDPLFISLAATMENMLAHPPTANLKLEARLSLDQLDRRLSRQDRLSGDLALTAVVQGDLSNPEAAITMNYGGGKLDMIHSGPSVLDLVLTDRKAEIRRLSVATGSGKLAAAGHINLQPVFQDGFFKPPTDIEGLEYDLSLKVSQISLAEVIRLDQPVAGIFDVEAMVRGKGLLGEAAEALASLSAKAQNLAIGPQVPPLTVETTAQASLINNTVTLDRLQVTAGGMELAASGRYVLASQQAAADLRLIAPDVAYTLKSLGITGPRGKNVDLRLNLEGDLRQPTASLVLQMEKGGFNQIRVGDVTLSAGLSSHGDITIAELAIHNQGSAIAGQGKMNLFQDGFRLNPVMPMELAVSLKTVDVSDFMSDSGVSGKISGQITAAGENGVFGAVAALSGTNIQTQPAAIGDVRLKAQLENGRVTIKELNILNQETMIDLTGWAELFAENSMTLSDDPAFYLMLAANQVRIADFLTQSQGTCALHATAQGTFKQPWGEAVITADDLRLALPDVALTLGDLDLAAKLAPSGELTIATLSLRNNGAQLTANGRLWPFKEHLPLELRAEFNNLKYADFLPTPEINGQLSGSLNLTGDIQKPVLKLSAQAQKLAFAPYRIGDVLLDAEFAAGRIVVAQLALNNRHSTLTLSGEAELFEPIGFNLLEQPTFTCKVNIPSAELGDFYPSFKGHCSLDAELQGDLLKPQGHLKLSLNRLDFGAQTIEQIDLTARADGEAIFLEPLRIRLRQQESLSAVGKVNFNQTFDVKLTSDGVNLHEIDYLEEILAAQDIAGKVKLAIEGRGDFSNPVISGNIALFELAYQQHPLDDIVLDVTLRDKTVTADIRQNFAITGQYHLEQQDFSATAAFQGLQLDPFFSIGGLEQFTGSLTGEIQAAGKAAALKKINLQAHLTDLDLKLDEVQLITSKDIRFLLNNGAFSIPGINLSILSHGSLDVAGSGNLDGSVALTAAGKIPLHTVTYFVEDLDDIAGDLVFTATVNGMTSAPEIKADINIQQLSLTVPELYQKLHSVQGAIQVTEKRIKITSLDGQLDSGKFHLKGELALEQFQPGDIDLKFSATALPIKIPDMLELTLNSELTFNGNSEQTYLKGEVTLIEGLYYKDVNLNMNILKGATDAAIRPKRQTAPRSAEMNQPYLKNMGLNVLIKRRNPLIVDNDLAQLEISPDLHLTGKLSHPIMSGRAAIDSGSVTYHKKMFEVKKGVIDFLNPYNIEPTIDLESDLKIRDWLIYLRISGTPDKLIFNLTSKPPEEHGDILSLLLFDKTTRELIDGEGGNSQSTNQMLANLIAATFGEDLKKATGLDILEVETNGAEETSERVTVTLGKQLSRRITLKYAIESTDGETVQKAITEYKFLENVIINGFQNSKGIFGGEVQYRIEFR